MSYNTDSSGTNSPFQTHSFKQDSAQEREIDQDSSSSRESHDESDEALPATEDTDSEDATGTDDSSTRPKHGPASTWRDQTASEREIAVSLDQLEAKDLALHLYNVYALKRGAKNGNVTHPRGWVPPDAWTAWPLAPSVVPRENEDSHWEHDGLPPSYRNRSTKLPHEWLGDILVGHALKKAKEALSRQKLDNRNTSLDEAASLPPFICLNENGKPVKLEPVVMEDDDQAADLLRPSLHHVFQQLGNLLGALRQARITQPSHMDNVDEIRDEDGRVEEKPGHKDEKLRFAFAPASSGLGPSSSKTHSASLMNRKNSRVEKAQTRQSQKSKTRRHLQGWSDVLGMASLAGWDSQVVQRAAVRCASIYQEGMSFRRFEENRNDTEISIFPDRIDINPCNFQAGLKWEKEIQSGQGSTPIPPTILSSRHPVSRGLNLYCPVADCPRSTRGFADAYRVKRHLRQVHKSNSEPNVCARTNRSDSMVGGVHVDGFLEPIQATGAMIAQTTQQ